MFCKLKERRWWVREVSKEIGKLANKKRIRKLEKNQKAHK